MGWDLKKASTMLKVSERFLKNEVKKIGAAGPDNKRQP
jgi:hypothetical protein